MNQLLCDTNPCQILKLNPLTTIAINYLQIMKKNPFFEKLTRAYKNLKKKCLKNNLKEKKFKWKLKNNKQSKMKKLKSLQSYIILTYKILKMKI